VLERDLMVRARSIQELLKVVPGWRRLGRVALGARRIALHHHDEVVVTMALVILIILFKARGCPLAVVHDLLPLIVRCVQCRGDRFLAVDVVACDVEELTSCARHATPELMDEGGACRAILEHRAGDVVGGAGELGAALGEGPYVLAKTLPQMLLAVVQLPLLVRAHVRALEVAYKDSTQVGPVIDLVPRQVFEPRARSVVEVERQVLDDEEVVGRSTGVACELECPLATR
jgi:hypothetical protein